ncbi:heavy-metal-associated domain-containing protein [Telmatospirillum sp. J64-1]|uniref:heavy-metal-associated domain-containing protein n=1 Tax=Telmatospirillum sp. J64-1 TaxID=2502183 RepID=UPI00115E71FA|nr:heavy-metal-associated domain-containing protein [Telmatospirillum sp. J64-1]
MAKTYRVSGMTCGGCARSVEKAIQTSVPGAQVTIELQSGRVTVEGACSDDQIERAVTEAGFDYEGVAS